MIELQGGNTHQVKQVFSVPKSRQNGAGGGKRVVVQLNRRNRWWCQACASGWDLSEKCVHRTRAWQYVLDGMDEAERAAFLDDVVISDDEGNIMSRTHVESGADGSA